MQCLRDYIFLPLSYVFALKLRESLLKSLKITLEKIVKSILRCRKTIINSPKNSFWKKQLCKERVQQVAAGALGGRFQGSCYVCAGLANHRPLVGILLRLVLRLYFRIVL